jgi:hypothetical protein
MLAGLLVIVCAPGLRVRAEEKVSTALRLASTGVVEIRGARRRAERPSTSLARCAAG